MGVLKIIGLIIISLLTGVVVVWMLTIITLSAKRVINRLQAKHNDLLFPLRYKTKNKIRRLAELNLPKDWKLEKLDMDYAKRVRKNVYTVHTKIGYPAIIAIEGKGIFRTISGEIYFNLIDNSCTMPWGLPMWKKIEEKLDGDSNKRS